MEVIVILTMAVIMLSTMWGLARRLEKTEEKCRVLETELYIHVTNSKARE